MAHTVFLSFLKNAVDARQALFDPDHQSAIRLFSGFTEGAPDLVIDLYGSTLVFHNYAEEPALGMELVQQARDFILAQYPWLRAGSIKTRRSKMQEERRGVLLFGDRPDRKILENGIWYAVDLTMNRDASFYLDTRNLRHWLKENTTGQTVLNTFAYTGSLGGLYAHAQMHIGPVMLSGSLSVLVVLLAMIGGMGTIVGPLLGGILLSILNEALRVVEVYRIAIYTGLLIVFIYLAPQGFVNLDFVRQSPRLKLFFLGKEESHGPSSGG